MFANVSQQITVAFIDGHIAAFENLNTMSIIHLFFPYWSYSGPLWKFIAPPIDAITKLQLIIVFCIILKSKKKIKYVISAILLLKQQVVQMIWFTYSDD